MGPGSRYLACSVLSWIRLAARSSRSSICSFVGLGLALSQSAMARSTCCVRLRCWMSHGSRRLALRRPTNSAGKMRHASTMPRRYFLSRLFHAFGSVSVRPVRPVSLPSLSSRTVVVFTSPLPEPSTTSIIFGRPSGVVCSPGAPGSTPVSKMATITPRPSYCGCSFRNCAAPVARLGMSAVKGWLPFSPGSA